MLLIPCINECRKSDGKMGHWGYQELILVLGSLAKIFTVFKTGKSIYFCRKFDGN